MVGIIQGGLKGKQNPHGAARIDETLLCSGGLPGACFTWGLSLLYFYVV